VGRRERRLRAAQPRLQLSVALGKAVHAGVQLVAHRHDRVPVATSPSTLRGAGVGISAGGSEGRRQPRHLTLVERIQPRDRVDVVAAVHAITTDATVYTWTVAVRRRQHEGTHVAALLPALSVAITATTAAVACSTGRWREGETIVQAKC
jgi:hypothetical protein